MNVCDLRQRLVEGYARYTRSFIKIADPRIIAKVDGALDDGALWPDPLIQLNPTFEPGGTIDELVADGTLHPECRKIFRIDKSNSLERPNVTVAEIYPAESYRHLDVRIGAGAGRTKTQRQDRREAVRHLLSQPWSDTPFQRCALVDGLRLHLGRRLRRDDGVTVHARSSHRPACGGMPT